jgi:ADP-ribose pyrophosphatase YjhB (NUDIX family)
MVAVLIFKENSMLPHRIAAGALVFHNDAVLLVRYRDSNGGTYLAAPGGQVELNETVLDAAIREVLEETGAQIETKHVVAIEDLICSKFKMCKIWIAATYISGEIGETIESKKEGITQVKWFTRSELEAETVFPSLLKEVDWSLLASDKWTVSILPVQTAGF